MKKEKKPLTVKQKQQRHYIYSKLLFASKPVVTALPLAITLGVKSNEWFAQDWKIATGGTIAIIIMGIASLLVGKKTEDEKNITNTWITLVLGWYVVAFIFMLLRDIADQIYWIMLVGGTGMLAAAGIDYAEQQQISSYKKYKEASEEAEKDIIKEEVKEEKKKVAVD